MGHSPTSGLDGPGWSKTKMALWLSPTQMMPSPHLRETPNQSSPLTFGSMLTTLITGMVVGITLPLFGILLTGDLLKVTWLDANEYGSEGPWILKIQIWSLIYDS